MAIYRTWAARGLLLRGSFLLTAWRTGRRWMRPFMRCRTAWTEVVLARQRTAHRADDVLCQHSCTQWAAVRRLGEADPSDEGSRALHEGKKDRGLHLSGGWRRCFRKPDLVIGLRAAQPACSRLWKENHIPFLLLSLSRFEDVKRAVDLNEVSGRRDLEADGDHEWSRTWRRRRPPCTRRHLISPSFMERRSP